MVNPEPLALLIEPGFGIFIALIGQNLPAARVVAFSCLLCLAEEEDGVLVAVSGEECQLVTIEIGEMRHLLTGVSHYGVVAADGTLVCSCEALDRLRLRFTTEVRPLQLLIQMVQVD